MFQRLVTALSRVCGGSHPMPLAVLLWAIAFGLVWRIVRVVDVARTSGRASDLGYAVAALGVDVGFALLLYAVAAVLQRAAGRVPWIARTLVVLVLLMVLFLSVGSALSFHVSGSALTLQRLRGDDGATVRDINLLDWDDVWPFALFYLVGLFTTILAVATSFGLDRWSERARLRVVVSTVVVGGIALALYEVAFDGRDHGIGRHPIGIFLESALQEFGERPALIREFRAPAATPEGWERLFTPRHPQEPPPPTPTRARPSVKNVLVFFAEGVPLKHTSLDPAGPPTTPRLKARVERNGLVVERMYSPYHRSIHALHALLCGDYPNPNALGITLLNPRIDCDEWSTAFSDAGLIPAFFHGGYFSFYDKTRFLSDRDYAVLEDATVIGDDDDEKNDWGVDDRAMVRRALQWIDSLGPGQRFAAVLVPITAHYPFTVPADVPRPFVDERKIDRFRNAVFFLDLVFDELMQGLEERGLLDDTVVFFTADHGESPFEPPRISNTDRAAYEYDVRVPGVLFSRGMFPTPQRTTRLTAIPDILPTMLDASGVQDKRQRQGQSLLSDHWRERRVFLGAARSNIHLVGFIDGFDKFLLNVDTGRAELYSLASDPDELNDLSEERPAEVEADIEIALTWQQWQSEALKNAPRLDSRPDVQQTLASIADVDIVDPDGNRTQCTAKTAGDTARECPGLPADFYPGVVRRNVANGKRDCLYLRAPPGKRLEFTVREAADELARVSMIQFAVPGSRLTPEVAAALHAELDGERVSFAGKVGQRLRRAPRFPLRPAQHELKLVIDNSSGDIPSLCVFFSVAAWAPVLDTEPRGD